MSGDESSTFFCVESTLKRSFDIVEVPSGRRGRVRMPFQGKGYGIDDPLLRDGWVLLGRGFSVVAVRDGQPGSAVPVPGRHSAPALDPALALTSDSDLVRRIDADGTVLAQTTIPTRSGKGVGSVVGDLADGTLVMNWARLTTDGELVEEWPGLYAEAVLGGRWIVLKARQRFLVRDVETGAEASLSSDWDHATSWGQNPSGTAVALQPFGAGAGTRDDPPIWVARAGEEPTSIATGLGDGHGCWLDDDRILFVAHAKRRRAIVDTRTGAVEPWDVWPAGLYPELNVTGRFAVDDFDVVAPKKPATPAAKDVVAGPVEQAVPAECTRWLAAGNQFRFDPAGLAMAGLVLADAPRRVELAVNSKGQEWAVDDPHADGGGDYLVPADSLVAECDDFDPTGLLVWLPIEAVFASWDSDHGDLITFPGATWADIAADPIRYLDAPSNPAPGDTYLSPVGRHPFVADGGDLLDL